MFVANFPLFERLNGALTYMHMPFVAPLEADMALLNSARNGARHPLRSVINGVEMGLEVCATIALMCSSRFSKCSAMGAAEARRLAFCSRLSRLEHPTWVSPLGSIVCACCSLGGELARRYCLSESLERRDLLLGRPSAVEPQQLRELQLRLA